MSRFYMDLGKKIFFQEAKILAYEKKLTGYVGMYLILGLGSVSKELGPQPRLEQGIDF